MKYQWLLCIALWISSPSRALAHAGEQGFVLLLPTELYITGGTTAVAVSLGLVAFLSKGQINTLFSPLDFGAGQQETMLPKITSLCATIVFAA
ncbi:MAG: hypothetical protein WBC93_20500, partial [Sulfitobacter sp.]